MSPMDFSGKLFYEDVTKSLCGGGNGNGNNVVEPSDCKSNDNSRLSSSPRSVDDSNEENNLYEQQPLKAYQMAPGSQTVSLMANIIQTSSRTSP